LSARGFSLTCLHRVEWARHCGRCARDADKLRSSEADLRARLKAARPICGQIHFCDGDAACVWCRAFRATDLRVRDWKGKP
jgi:hypothetical protein